MIPKSLQTTPSPVSTQYLLFHITKLLLTRKLLGSENCNFALFDVHCTYITNC